MLGLTVSALAMTVAKADPKAPDSDASSAKVVPGAHRQIFKSGSCHDLGYAWPGIAFPILAADHRRQPVTAYICQRDFQFAPHDWP
jgi:hypothetical protein